MKKLSAILMSLMLLAFTQCKPSPEGTEEENTTRKVEVSCVIALNNDNRSDFSNLMKGKINWSDGREYAYVAIHGDNPQIIELEGWADGNPSKLEFTGKAEEGLITSGEQYDIWYFGHSQQSATPYINLNGEGDRLEGSVGTQSGRLEELGYCHIATTKVSASIVDGDVKLNLNGALDTKVAIALLDLENVTELYGDAIVGTDYALQYNDGTGRYELDVIKANNARINVEEESGISYVMLLPNDKKKTQIKCKKEDKIYAYTFHNYIKANQVYFRTSSDGTTVEPLKWEELETPEIDNHECVDLGLPSGLKWATCNVGANSPEEYGDYYAWGETTTKAEYTDENSLLIGKEMDDISGNVEYDAAAANWGGDWRMPKYTEFEELVNECTWIWVTQNGVNGYSVIGPNGNSIFLPAAGSHYYLPEPQEVGDVCAYWNSMPIPDMSACCIYYTAEDYGDLNITSLRSCGFSIRPVITTR